jgi:hypothetical protein
MLFIRWQDDIHICFIIEASFAYMRSSFYLTPRLPSPQTK